MRVLRCVLWLSLFFLGGCTAFNTAGSFQSGRNALLVNDPERALPYFLVTAESDPNYVFRAVYFHEGIWTYVGRSQYLTKRYAEARQSLERAVTMDRDDLLARLYLGLTLARGDDRARGYSEILAGMKAIHEWLEYINQARPFEAYWDPLREIRKAIEVHLRTGRGGDAPYSDQLVADAEWLGAKLEDEIERVRWDERRRYERDFDRRRGGSVGIGIGF